LALLAAACCAAVPAAQAVSRITWEDAAPVRAQLQARGLVASAFPAYVDEIRQVHARRVREGDVDHLIYYLLQSKRFTDLPAIEPAVSARALVERLDAAERDRFLQDPALAAPRIETAVRTRAAALLRALDGPADDPRLAYFRELTSAVFPAARDREAGLLREYLRVMRFVYEKEFVAQRAERPAQAVAELYRTRGLSTDTAVEAGYLVYLGLGVLQSLAPAHAIRRVLIVGPGLDLAPRTALDETGPPESYQPWAVIDALLSLRLATAEQLEVVAADINPRVVNHLRRSRVEPPVLTLVSEIADSETVTLAGEYRDYFAMLGRAVGDVDADARGAANGHLRKRVKVRPQAAGALRAETLDIVTERLGGGQFDLIVATNILPYFDDTELTLALANIGAMLAPGGAFLHNEARPVLQDVTAALGMRLEQSRHAVIATVRGAPAPLFDSVWVHRRSHRRQGDQEKFHRR
jgi:hypothetical protein